MSPPATLRLASCLVAVVALGCAKAPEARPGGATESSVEPSTASGVEPSTASGVASSSDAGTGADARVPGLPMPQKFPHVVWDAAGAPPRDAAAPVH